MPQSLAAVFVHTVFSTKNREPVLQDSWREELFFILGGTTNTLGNKSILVGGIADHVHLLFGQARTVTLAHTIQEIKKVSSSWIPERHPVMSEFHCQGGYGMFSVSQSNVDTVKEYIRNQESHHLKQSFQDEYREWLQRYGLNWDERYVWD